MSTVVDGLYDLDWNLKILVAATATAFFYALWLKRRKRLAMDKPKDGSSVDRTRHEVERLDPRVPEVIKVNVQLINGQCFVENGDEKLNAKCNAALAELNNFQREFLSTAPAGQPNKMVFSEEVVRDAGNWVVHRKAYFQPYKPEEKSGFLNIISGWFTWKKNSPKL